jgi:protein translocase SecG subunit
MDTVVYVISILMWILCPAIIGLILLQGAAGDISSAFGGGGQLDASLGVGAHRKMAQVTGALAVLFFIMVLFMAYPHRGSFQNMKNAPAPAAAPAAPAAPADQAKPEAAKPAEAAPPVVLPEAAKPAAAAPEAPVQVQAQPQAQPEPAKPVEAAPAPQPEAAKPAEPVPTTVPMLAPAPAPAEPAKP